MTTISNKYPTVPAPTTHRPRRIDIDAFYDPRICELISVSATVKTDALPESNGVRE